MEENVNQKWSIKGSALLKIVITIFLLLIVLAGAYGASVAIGSIVLDTRYNGKLTTLHELYQSVGRRDAQMVLSREYNGSKYDDGKVNDRSNFIYEMWVADNLVAQSDPDVVINHDDPLTIRYADKVSYVEKIEGLGYYTYETHDENRVVYLYIDVSRGFLDRYSIINTYVEHVYKYSYRAIALALVALALFAILIVILCSMAGRYGKYGELKDNILSKIWLEVIVAINVLIVSILVVGAEELSSHTVIIVPYLVGAGLVLALCVILFVMNIAHRIKVGGFWRRTLTGLICIWLCKGTAFVARSVYHMIKKLNLMWRTALAAIILVIVFLFLVAMADGDLEGTIIASVICGMFVLAFMFVSSYMLLKLERGIDNLSEGRLSEPTNVKHLFPTFRRAAEKINKAAEGMNKAVEERIKSERMRTELITNVSHDIKTPLTSIINYSDLICNEPVDNEKVTEYATILNRQGNRLKRLLEDLLEASKASTGNLEVVLGPCNLNVLVSQVAAEYEEKFRNAGLTLITEVPKDEITIMADGRRLSRVLDNLLNNACKYSLTGTRVYMSAEANDAFGRIIIKNTSSARLNVSPNELMERFVRGDESRNTEGSGLGLSIAQSLTELQGGKLALAIDGDLFKAIVCMERAEKNIDI